MASAQNSTEHVMPSNVGPPSRLPVMANQYSTNAHYISKRAAPMPPTVNYNFSSTDRVNKFKTDNG